MITRVASALALTSLLATAAAAQPAPGNILTLQPESRLWVEGTSTVRDFSCRAPQVEATVETSSVNAITATLGGDRVVNTIRVEVPARSLDCENGTMNGHMYKAIKADQHPMIVFRLTSYELAPKGAEAATVTLKGKLQLGGQEKDITLSAEARQGPAGTLQVTGTQELRLTDFGLKPPSLMLGTMKVGDVVEVKYDLFLKA
jgi:polyisoprenoid-binding protein YceI